jgi:hypothetical protein
MVLYVYRKMEGGGEMSFPAGGLLRGNRTMFNLGSIHGKPLATPRITPSTTVPNVDLEPLFDHLPPIESLTLQQNSPPHTRKITINRTPVAPSGTHTPAPDSPEQLPEQPKLTPRRLFASSSLLSGPTPIREKSVPTVVEFPALVPPPEQSQNTEPDFPFISARQELAPPQGDPVSVRSTIDSFESSVCNVLDRSFGNFKRIVTRDITSAFRANLNTSDPGIYDNFLVQLLSDITNAFIPPGSAVSEESDGIVLRLNSAFDEGAKPVRRILQDAEARASQSREKKVTELKQLANSVGELRSSVKTIMDATLQELEKERFEAATRRDQEQAKSRNIERKSRALKLKSADLDSRLKHQKIEKESIERLTKQMDETRREWEENSADTSNSITAKLQKEAELLRTELSNDTTAEFGQSLDQCVSLMVSVRDALKDEVCEMELTERWAVSRLRSPMRKAPFSKAEPIGKHKLLDAAKERIMAHRKQRELSIREVNESLRVLGENQAQ